MNISDTFLTHNTTGAREAGRPDLHDDYVLDIEWWIYTFVTITLPLVGGFGNILTFIVNSSIG